MTHCPWCDGDVPDDAGPCPLSFACPTCQQAPGHWCKRPSGHRAAELHATRRSLEFTNPDSGRLDLTATAAHPTQTALF